MANKKISDFTEETSPGANDWIEIETSGGNSRKVKKSNLAGGAFTTIQTVTTTSGQTSVTLTPPSSGYKHLKIRAYHGSSVNNSTTTTALGMQFNGDTGSNYHATLVGGYGAGTATSGGAQSSTNLYTAYNASAGTSGVPLGYTEIDIPDFLNTTRKQHFRAECACVQGNVGSLIGFAGGYWNNDAAITSIVLLDRNGNAFLTGSEFELIAYN